MTDPGPVSRVDWASEPGKKRRLAESHTFQWQHDGLDYQVKVPSGYAYEVTVPRPVRAVMVLVWGYYALEDVSCGHDWLYRHRGADEWIVLKSADEEHYQMNVPITRKEADTVLLSNPDDPWPLKHLAYYYCRAFGWWMWYDVGERIRDAAKRTLPDSAIGWGALAIAAIAVAAAVVAILSFA